MKMKKYLIKTDEEYYAIKGRLSASGLKYLNIHPKAYDNYAKSGIATTQAMETGKLLHSLLLEPETVKALYTYLRKKDLPNPDKDFRDKDNKAYKIKFHEDNKDKTIFDSEDDYWNLYNLSQAIHANADAKRILSDITVELGMAWNCPITGVPIKSKPDGFKANEYILDVKKFPDISPKKVQGYLVDRFIHSQLALYGRGLEEFGFGTMKDYYIIAIQEKPADFAIYRINDFIEDGWKEYARLVTLYKQCLDSGKWGGYETLSKFGDGVVDLYIPAYAQSKFDLVVDNF